MIIYRVLLPKARILGDRFVAAVRSRVDSLDAPGDLGRPMPWRANRERA